MMPKDSSSRPPFVGQADDAVERQREILGAGPRILPLRAREVGPEGLAIVASLRKATGLDEAGEIPDVVATLLRHPRLYEKHAAVGVALLGDGALSPRQRELAVLRTAWLCGAPFEWGEHVAIAKRAGISSEEIERLARDTEAADWNEIDRAIILAAEELYHNAMISDETWAVLSAHLEDRHLIELIYVVGHYTKVAYLQNALRLSPGSEGLAAR